MALSGTINKTVVMYHDFYQLDGAVVTASSELSDEYSADNLHDDKDYLPWRPADTSDQTWVVDLGDGTGGTPGPMWPTYLAFLGHNLGSQGVMYSLQASTDGIVWSFGRGPFGIGNDLDHAPVFLTGPGGTGSTPHRYWRFLFTGVTADTFISEIKLGCALSFDQMPQPGVDPQFGSPIYEQSSGEVGFFVEEPTGNNVVRQVRYTFSMLPESFINDTTSEANLTDWIERFAFRGRPFVINWNAGTPGFFRPDILFGPLVRGMTEQFETQLDSWANKRALAFSVIGKKKKRVQTLADYGVLE